MENVLSSNELLQVNTPQQPCKKNASSAYGYNFLLLIDLYMQVQKAAQSAIVEMLLLNCAPILVILDAITLFKNTGSDLYLSYSNSLNCSVHSLLKLRLERSMNQLHHSRLQMDKLFVGI